MGSNETFSTYPHSALPPESVPLRVIVSAGRDSWQPGSFSQGIAARQSERRHGVNNVVRKFDQVLPATFEAGNISIIGSVHSGPLLRK